MPCGLGCTSRVHRTRYLDCSWFKGIVWLAASAGCNIDAHQRVQRVYDGAGQLEAMFHYHVLIIAQPMLLQQLSLFWKVSGSEFGTVHFYSG